MQQAAFRLRHIGEGPNHGRSYAEALGQLFRKIRGEIPRVYIFRRLTELWHRNEYLILIEMVWQAWAERG